MTSRMYYSEDARQRALTERTLLAILCLVFGLTAGAVMALLFAPEKGEKLRNTLAKQANTLRQDVEERVTELVS